MFSKDEILKAQRQANRIIKLDESGKTHPFYSYRPLDQMPGQKAFFHSEARLQAFIAGNKVGKTYTLHQKLRCLAVGYDPSRPTYKFPFDDKYKMNIWLICPPDMVSKELEDLHRGFPRDLKRKVYRSSGHQRIEIEPTPERPLGASIYVKSRQKPIEEFQYDVCHVIAYDEQPPEEIWNECGQRLTMTQGWIMISLTPVLGVTWLHTKLRKLDKAFQNAMDGPFGWYTASQFENPHIPKGEIEHQAQGYSETEYAIRVLGEYKLLAGSQFFSQDILAIHKQKFIREPEFALNFVDARHGVYSAWNEKSSGWKVWTKPEQGRSYVIGADVASGKGGDYSVAHVIDSLTGEQCATFRDRFIEPVDFGIELALMGLHFNTAMIFPEVNSDGAAVLHALRSMMVYPRIGRRMSYGGRIDNVENTYGWMTGRHNKKAACQDLFAALRNASQEKPGLILRDEVTLDELASFGHLNENRPGAYGLGALEGHDDCVMSLAIGFQGLEQAPKVTPRADIRIIRNYAQNLVDKGFEQAEEEWKKAQESPLDRDFLSIVNQ